MAKVASSILSKIEAEGARGNTAVGWLDRMRVIALVALTLTYVLGAGVQATTTPPGAAPLRLVQTIPMGGVEGRIDHLAIDVAGRRLFVCALGNGTLEVVDLDKGQRVQSVPGFKEPQGTVFMPKTKTVAVASGGDGRLTFLDGPPFKPTKTIAIGDDADNVRYDPEHERIYVGYGDGALAIADAMKSARVGEVPLEAHPESFQRESTGRIFVNEASRARVAVIDAEKSAVISRWELGEGRRPTSPWRWMRPNTVSSSPPVSRRS